MLVTTQQLWDVGLFPCPFIELRASVMTVCPTVSTLAVLGRAPVAALAAPDIFFARVDYPKDRCTAAAALILHRMEALEGAVFSRGNSSWARARSESHC